jgi:hypothetical protein
LGKTLIICQIVNQVRKNSPNGGFVKKDPLTGRYYEVGDFLAREKTSQAFRDALHDQYKSSNAAKKKRRLVEQAQKLHHSAPSLSTTTTAQPQTVAATANYSGTHHVALAAEPSLEDLLGELDSQTCSALAEENLTNKITFNNSAKSVMEFPDMMDVSNIVPQASSGFQDVMDFSKTVTQASYYSAQTAQRASCPEFGQDSALTTFLQGGYTKNSMQEPNAFMQPNVLPATPLACGKPNELLNHVLSNRTSPAPGRAAAACTPLDQDFSPMVDTGSGFSPEGSSSDHALFERLVQLTQNCQMQGDPFEPSPLP